LIPIGIEVRGITDKSLLPYVEENGTTGQENARKKAITYAKALDAVVLSMDNALYFDELLPEEQPGLNVRRINTTNVRPSDDDLLTYYSQLVKKFGDRTMGRWEFAICIATPDGRMEEINIVSPRIFTSLPSSKIVAGYPLESIQIDPRTGRYISEMTQEEQDLFWQEAIGKPLQEFVKKVQF
jgi:inosine/xanthosine triphosphate pyrophosphatase family protein